MTSPLISPSFKEGEFNIRAVHTLLLLLITAIALPAYVSGAEPRLSQEVAEFLVDHCFDCHQGEEAEAGLDLEAISLDISRPEVIQRWVHIFDRVHDGEMPPPDYGELEKMEAAAFLKNVGEPIHAIQRSKQESKGRVLSRRLTRKQVERTLHDLLSIDIPLAEFLPEESRQGRYSTVADGQAMSHFQMQAHLAVVDRALDEAYRRAFSTEDDYHRDFDAQGLSRKNPKRRCREPEMRQSKAVIWSNGITFYGRLPATTAPADGWYRFALTVSALKPPKDRGVWATIHTGLGVSSAPLLTYVDSFEATIEPRTIEFEAWLPKGHMLEIRPGDATLKKASFAGGQIGTGEGEAQNVPGIAFDRLTMRQFHRAGTNEEVRSRLFGNLTVREGDVSAGDASAEAERLLLEFAKRAFRRPVERDSIAPYILATQTRLKSGDSFREALRYGYRAILCSPRFLYFVESPGQLDSHAIATRTSYLLTGSCPDDRLRVLADSNQLVQKEVLAAEVERLLSTTGSQFIKDFAAEWLDLEKINETIPDRKLYPEFDAIVGASMLAETHSFLRHLLDENQSVVRLIDGEFTFVNSRLARYYGLDDVETDDLQFVSLPRDSRRGGLLTHGSILKITANGTNTSPVLRGVWVCERLLGIPIPPPPENVPAIEPDIRGAATIRDQLELHRSNDECASCHRKIDPSGFALENFGPAGQWRDFYRKKKGGKGRSKKKIDASFQLSDGREFEDVRDFRRLVAADGKRLAANVVENLLVFGTGAPIEFADRDGVDKIVDEVATDDYGFRSIVHAVIASPIFLNK